VTAQLYFFLIGSLTKKTDKIDKPVILWIGTTDKSVGR
jgi:hypothetical protein